ncbi:MAG: SMI1/KNR4 family protein [Verrucomicrobiota bacterium]
MAILDRMANLADWQLFLKEYASAFGADEWPGNPGASESDLVKIEQRLKVTLPPSYRAFLKASNGWRKASDSVPVLRSVEKIKWFRKENREWVDAYVAPQQGMESPISDVDYFSYTAEGSAKFDGKHLAQTLCISDEGDSAVLLLNPMVV